MGETMRRIIIAIITVIIILTLLLIYPNIKYTKNNTLYVFTYKEDYGIYEENMCYGENYSYNKEYDISINKWNIKKFLFFKVLVLNYIEGNICNSEYYLEESYINNFINNAEIIENENNINLKELIKNRKAIIGNKKYYTEEEKSYILYKLDNEEKEMFIFYQNDLLIIQVGSSDEGPKYIAYKKGK